MTATEDPDTTTERPTSPRVAVLCGVAAYVAWGLVPLYFKQVASVPPIAVLAHRVVWSVGFLAILVTVQNLWRELLACFRSRSLLLALTASAFAVAINWFTFIYAISNGRILQSSLGYFMTPLVSVALGVIVLHERLRRWQLVGLILVVVGVAIQLIGAGQMPWIALSLAISFSTYGLLRKQMRVGPLIGLTVETVLMLPLAICVALLQMRTDLASGASLTHAHALLPLSGLVTAIPLLLFARAARSLRLSTIGFLQYLSPTGQFLLALAVYHEPISMQKWASFALIWVALGIYSFDSYRAARGGAQPPLSS